MSNKNVYTVEKPKFSSCFSLADTLECGQFFRHYKAADNNYDIVVGDKLINIVDEPDHLKLTTYFDDNSIVEYVENLLDFNTNYDEIKSFLTEDDEIMQEAIRLYGGIHIMNQEPFETLLSFIISQNNNIPRIRGIINRLTKTYGENIGCFHESDDDFYSFPTVEKLVDISSEDFSVNCGTGFRSKYLVDAVNCVASGQVMLGSETEMLKTEELRENLMTIYGVGRKVSDCCLLFSFKRKEVFPLDVWIKRVMQRLYFNNKEVSNDVIQKFAKEKFGEYAGVAQEYLFHYAKNHL